MSFEDFRRSISPVSPVRRQGAPEAPPEDREALTVLERIPRIDRDSLSELVCHYPGIVPYLALCVGLSRERLRGELKQMFGMAGWKSIAQRDPFGLIDRLDAEYGLVTAVASQKERSWGFADVLVERLFWSRHRATASQARGRALEDQVEDVIRAVGVPYVMRTSFKGRGDKTVPCDFAIPEGGRGARVVGAVKGFDSTGSKLSDAKTEIESMAETRLPRQFVYVVVDGIGWLRRDSDLRKIYAFYEKNLIDGIFTAQMLGEFRQALEVAAQRIGLL